MLVGVLLPEWWSQVLKLFASQVVPQSKAAIQIMRSTSDRLIETVVRRWLNRVREVRGDHGLLIIFLDCRRA